jgi:hypothetical protein
MAAEVHSYDVDEKFEFSSSLKKNILLIGGLGLLFLVIGLFQVMGGGGHGEHALMEGMEGTAMSGGGEAHGASWMTRVFANMWINNVFFTGVAVAGVFFFAIQYLAMAGWSVAFLRIMRSFGSFLPLGFVLMLGGFLLAGHDLFHWTHESLYEVGGAEYDKIIDGKKAFFFFPLTDHPHIPVFYLARMVLFIGVWILFWMMFGKESQAEDIEGGTKRYRKLVKLSAGFIVFFAVSSSISAWDWVMSIDTHWFSTMFGWYVFASWFVASLAGMTFVATVLKDMGYLKIVNENHLHDMGKFVFAFSVFWTYIWFSQFLLIYYANIPEESVYFLERLNSDHYGKFIFINLFMNFIFPFLGLMTRDAKRKHIMLKIVCGVVMVGHWLDFYLMVTPGTLKEAGGFNFLEIGMAMVYLSVFAFMVFSTLAKGNLIPKHHPMLDECIHHTT